MEGKFVTQENMQAYTKELKTKVAAEVAAANHLKRKIAASASSVDLTAADADQYLYMVPKEGGEAGDLYDEYMVIEGKLERIGSTAMDLTGYVKESDLQSLTEEDIQGLFENWT